MTTYTVDNLPAPSDFELEAMDAHRELFVTPHTRCDFNCYVKLRNINDERPYFHAFVTDQGRAKSVLALWQWDSLLATYDSIDERETMRDALV